MAEVTDISRLHVREVIGLLLRGRATTLGAPDRGPRRTVAGRLDVEHVAALITLVHGDAQVADGARAAEVVGDPLIVAFGGPARVQVVVDGVRRHVAIVRAGGDAAGSGCHFDIG